MILHLSIDSSFIFGAIKQFEEYYPSNNQFIIQVSKSSNYDSETLSKEQNVHRLPLTKKKYIDQIVQFAVQKECKYIFLHYLNELAAIIVDKVKSQIEVKVFWVFFGSDLYTIIDSRKKYNFDSFKINFYSVLLSGHTVNYNRNRFIQKLDYFCFWNEFDYSLLKENFNTKAQHKYFIYSNAIVLPNQLNYLGKKENQILINHAASESGNHIEIINKIKHLNLLCNTDKLIIPLNYGSQKVREQVILFADLNFPNQVKGLLNYMEKQDYFNLISSCKVAIFGHDQQEAAANIFYLIGNGTKVFLKSSNSIFHWLKIRGFEVFEFQEDLKISADLEELNQNLKEKNYYSYKKYFSKESEQEFMLNLLE